MEEEYSIERSIRNIHDILNHQQNGDLPEESVRLLKEELKLLKKYLAEREEVRKKELKLAGLGEFVVPDGIRISRDETKWLEPIRFEPKPLKTRPQQKSDGWRTPNKNPRRPVCRY
jgi:hypothetical protein